MHAVVIKILAGLFLKCPPNFILPAEPCKNYTLRSWLSCLRKFSPKAGHDFSVKPVHDFNVKFSLPCLITAEVEKILETPNLQCFFDKSRTPVRRSTRKKKKRKTSRTASIPVFGPNHFPPQKSPRAQTSKTAKHTETKRNQKHPNKKINEAMKNNNSNNKKIIYTLHKITTRKKQPTIMKREQNKERKQVKTI